MNLREKLERRDEASRVREVYDLFNEMLADYLIAGNEDCAPLHAMETIFNNKIQPSLRNARIAADEHQELMRTVKAIHKAASMELYA